MEKRRIVCGVLLAAVLALAAWMLWPRSLGEVFDPAFPLSAAVTRDSFHIEGDFTVQDTETVSCTVKPGSPEMEAVCEILGRYRCHLCLDSLTGETVIQDVGDVGVRIRDQEGRELWVSSAKSGKIFLNHRVVRAGYWGGAKGAALCKELAAVLSSA